MRALALSAVLLLGACAVVQKPDSVTVLRVSPRFETSASLGLPIAVAPVMAQGAAADRRYAYVERAAPGEVRQAASLFWEEPPARIVQRAVVDGLSALAAPAVGPGTPVDASRRLTVQLERFEESAGEGAEAVVVFEASLTQNRALVFSGRYCATAPIAGASPTDRARAFEAALSAAVVNLARDVKSGSGRAC